MNCLRFCARLRYLRPPYFCIRSDPYGVMTGCPAAFLFVLSAASLAPDNDAHFANAASTSAFALLAASKRDAVGAISEEPNAFAAAIAAP